MAFMNRNVNLEEIDSDAVLGIPFLIHQTLVQKIILVSGLVIGISLFLVGAFVFNLNYVVLIIVSFIPIVVGVLWGGNYNEDLSLAKYVSLSISKPSITLYSKPMEDIEQIRKKASELEKQEQIEKIRSSQTVEEQKKLFHRILIGFGLFTLLLLIVIIVLVSIKSSGGQEGIHHTVAMLPRVLI